MIKNVVIHDKQYSLSLNHGMVGKTSGVCYHLMKDGVDLAVKLYYSSEEGEKLYPFLFELNQFCEIHDQVLPVLVSEAPVFDEDGKYIGCSAPFIHEGLKEITDVVYRESLDFVLQGLSKFQETLSIFNQNKICIFDWRISNMKIGWIKDFGFGMYLYDDSYYSLSDESEETLRRVNQKVFNHLIASMIVDYYYYFGNGLGSTSSKEESMRRWNFCDRFDLEYPASALSLLEKETKGCLTLGNYLDQIMERGYR